MKPKKIPLRMCVGCRESKPKRELIRVVRAPDGTLSMDPVGKKPGRGAYICRDVACLKKVRKSGRVARSLECEITPDYCGFTIPNRFVVGYGLDYIICS